MINKDEIIGAIETVKGIKHSKEQLDILEHTGGMVVLAGAGSGKTTIITELLFKRIELGEINPKQLLCATYSKSGSQEMENRFNELSSKIYRHLGIKNPTTIKVKTLHACYYQILNKFGYELNIASEAQLNMFIRQSIKEANIEMNKENETEEYVKNLLSYQINRAMTDDELVQCYLFRSEEVTKEQYISIRNSFANLKRQNNLVDYDDLQLQIYNLLYFCGEQYEKLVLDYCKDTWRYFFIDEFQDTSTIQYRILRKLISEEESDKLVVIGDDDQSIYQWRGTDPNIILEDVQTDYRLTRFILPVNYRCKSEIVNFASKSVRRLSKRQDKELKAFEQGGNVEILVNNDGYSLFKMSKKVKEYINDLIYNKGVLASDIAVLCRNNNQVSILNNMLLYDGIYTNSSKGMKFTNIQLYSDFSCVFDFCEDTNSHFKVKSYLWKYIPFLGINGATLVSEIMNETGISLLNSIGVLLQNFSPMYGDRIEKDYSNIKMSNKVLAKMQYRFARINKDAVTGLYTLYENIRNTEKSDKDKIKELLWMCTESLAFLYKTPERDRILRGFKEYFSSLVEQYSIEEIKRMFKVAEQIDSGSSAILGDVVNFSTFHGAKGMEWKYVILFCCDSLTMPGFREINDMLDKGYTVDDVNTYLDCERRLYYVGCTRAKDKLVIMGDVNKVSPFLLESLEISDGMEEETNYNYRIIETAKNGMYSKSVIDGYKEKIGGSIRNEEK